jgi:two-component system KDP operon response regulator KdpE
MGVIKEKILIVEDEKKIGSLLKCLLENDGFEVIQAGNGQEARSCISSHCPDVIVLDLGLPDVDGNELIAEVRAWSSTPILVVSARSEGQDKIKALELGADDYMTKPFDSGEFVARVHTAIRHARRLSKCAIGFEGRVRIRELEIDYDKHKAYKNGVDCGLSHYEYKIVALLSKYAGKILTYETIIREIWGPNASSDNRILRVNMANIRRKIEKNPAQPEYIRTEATVGYIMTEE